MDESGYLVGWMMSATGGTSHLLAIVIMAVVVIYPVGLILRNLGYSPFWAILAGVPAVNVIGLWVVALGLTASRTEQPKAADPGGSR